MFQGYGTNLVLIIGHHPEGPLFLVVCLDIDAHIFQVLYLRFHDPSALILPYKTHPFQLGMLRESAGDYEG